MMQPSPPSARRPSPRQVLLGAFILLQIAFLFVLNFHDFTVWSTAALVKSAPPDDVEPRKRQFNRLAPNLADERSPSWSWVNAMVDPFRRWKELTYQDQDWSLFAPGIADATGFPALHLLWDEPDTETPKIPADMLAFDAVQGFNLNPRWTGRDAPGGRVEIVRSDNEPEDINRFLRVGNSKVRRFEGMIYLDPRPSSEEAPAKFSARLTSDIWDLMRQNHAAALAYLRWRLDAWQQAHPEEPKPKLVLLVHRLYTIRAPEEPRGWDGPFLTPMACWLPDAPRNLRYFELMPFNFSERTFHLKGR